MAQTTLMESLGAIEAEIAAGQAERALARCQDIQTRYPRALAVQRVLGEAWLALHKPREALGALDRTLAGNPEDVRACCARAIVHQMHGDAPAALAWYRRACDVRPDDQALRATYREMATQIGQPPYRPTRVGLARLYLRGGLFTHAIREWELLLAERPDLLDAQVGLVETLWRAGRPEQADEWARRVLVNAPSCEKALLISAIIAHDAERHDEAERLLQSVSLLDPDHRMAQALFADRLAAGDRALSVLLWGPNAPDPQPPFQPRGPQTPNGQASLQRSGVASGPAAPAASNAQSAPSAQFGRSPQPSASSAPALPTDQGLALGGPAGALPVAGALTQPLPPPPPRTSGLPTSFGNIFKETEGMIWDANDTESVERPAGLNGLNGTNGSYGSDGLGFGYGSHDASARLPPGSPPSDEPTASDTFARSTQFVPPMIAQQSGVMADTEAHMAINWVHWLQAQGARTIASDALGADGALPGATGPLAGRTPLSPPGTSEGSPPGSPSPTPPAVPWAADARPTQPLAPHPNTPSSAPAGRPPQASPFSQPLTRPGSDTAQAPSPPQRAAPTTAGPLWGGAPPRPLADGGAPTTPTAPLPSAPAASLSPALTAGLWGASAQRSGPLPPPSPEALRSMFAQLAPTPPAVDPLGEATREPGRMVIDAASSAASSDGVPSAVVDGAASTANQADVAAEAHADSAPWPAAADALVASDAALQSTPPTAKPSAPTMGATPLVALERGFAASGFEQFDAQPGALAALVADSAPISGALAADSPSTASGSVAPFAPVTEAPTSGGLIVEATSLATAAPPETTGAETTSDVTPEPPAIPAGPDPKDYAARLEQARRKRNEGALDEAFVDYTAVLRNAPDLLPEVMRDLETLSGEESAHPEAHRLLGDARIRQGDYMSALESLNRATALTQAQAQEDDE